MRIVVGTDESKAAERALELASKLGVQTSGSLTIVHVVNLHALPTDLLKEYALSEHLSLADVVNGFAEEALAAARRVAQAHGVKTVLTISPFGEVAEAILDAAREQDAQLIVVGRRGRGQLSGLMLGSVSQKLATVASCPVMVVP